jgi:hypothetical protein
MFWTRPIHISCIDDSGIHIDFVLFFFTLPARVVRMIDHAMPRSLGKNLNKKIVVETKVTMLQRCSTSMVLQRQGR